ncbi:uncharacterized protein LOC131665331 isoform X2 [Phymastichus coffea]|uniref:uncharacterized protein LOC131665331 isoform X2 n=1 Tax=Phymastichus coffea TaxID=108790 RepID=UPI00273C7D28|nr:uncharacterized protein LOC131665331 isoform X2 [Phymastichus coffea]
MRQHITTGTCDVPASAPLCLEFGAVSKLLALSRLCLGIGRPTLYDAGTASNELLAWLRDSARSAKPIVLPEDNLREEQASFGAFDDLVSSLQDERPFTRTDRSLVPEYRHLCETATRKVEFNGDPNYEYQPPHYYEVFCKSFSLVESESSLKVEPPEKQKCAHPSFHCIQRSRTLFMLRRRWDAACWEPTTKVVASGCDCMWPTSTLGDVTMHY